VGAHHDAGEEDDECRDGVGRESVGLRFAEICALFVAVVVVVVGGGGRGGGFSDGVVEEVADLDGLDEHAALEGG
jgi:acetyl-CoA carboxylase alpha subunit